MPSVSRCDRKHIGGPGLKVGRGCVHAGPLGAGLLLGALTGAAALSSSSCPWWAALIAFVFWPLFSIVGQLLETQHEPD